MLSFDDGVNEDDAHIVDEVRTHNFFEFVFVFKRFRLKSCLVRKYKFFSTFGSNQDDNGIKLLILGARRICDFTV